MERYKHHIIEEADEIEEAWAEGDMLKVLDGQVYRRADGQIGKPPGWYGPENELKLMLDRAGFGPL
jgi:hypothetical protein